MYDPLTYDPLDPVQRQAARGRQEWRRPADQATVDATGESLLHRGLSGLSYVGSILDKPGRAVRGLLGGKPHEMLAALPFSDSLGITKPEDAVSGAQLNKKYFGLRDNNSWGSWGAGLATELATDPLNLLTLGPKHALTTAGILTKKAGELAGMSRHNIVSGFEKTVPELLQSGIKPGAEIAHATERQGIRAASEGLVNSAAAKGVDIKSGTPLGGLAKISLPFSDNGLVLGTGKIGQSVARGMDKAGEFLNYNVPGAKTLSSWFDPTVAGATTRTGQELARKYLTPARDEFERQARYRGFDLTNSINSVKSQLAGNSTEPEILRGVRQQAIGVAPSASVLPLDPQVASATRGIADEIRQRGQSMLGEAREHGVGPGEYSDPFTRGYMHRAGLAKKGQSPQLSPNNGLPTGSGANIRRKDALSNVPGADIMLDKWGADPTLTGVNRTLAPVDVTAKLLQDMTDQAVAQGVRLPDVTKESIKNGQVVTRKITHEQQLAQTARKLARYLGKRAEPGEIFSPDVVASQARREAQHGRTVASSIAATKGLGDIARGLQPGDVAIPTLLRKMGIETSLGGSHGIQGGLVKAHEQLARHGLPMTEDYLANVMAPVQAARATGTPQDIARAEAQAMKDLKLEVGRFGVAPHQAQELLASRTPWETPHEFERPLKFWDSFTNAFRKGAYSAWLPSHVRNLVSSEVQSATQTGPHLQQMLAKRLLSGEATEAELRKAGLLSGFSPPGSPQAPAAAAAHPPTAQVAPATVTTPPAAAPPANPAQGWPGGVMPGWGQAPAPAVAPPANLDELARRHVMQHAYANAKVGAPVGHESDIAGAQAGTGSITPPTPGSIPWLPWMGVPDYLKGVAQTGKDAFAKVRDPFNAPNPLEMAGVGRGTKDFPALAAGHAMGRQTEDVVRLGQWLDLVKKGYSPAEAGKEVLRTQFDYSRLTGTERNIFRKAVPFYTFMRNNLPLQVERTLERPGVTSSQLRVAAGDHGEPLPQHLASGVAIPTGAEKDGNRQYISQLGIPLEEAFERFKVHPGDPLGSIRDTAMAYMGGLNPLIKGPLEHLFNTQFFSGRKLSDLRPQGVVGGLGKLIDPEARHPDLLNAVAQGLANTPATRFLTMLDKFQDPRKGIVPKALNLLTGVRVSDVDMEKTRAIETRRQLEELLKGNPAISQYTNLYVKPEDQAKLTSDEIQQMQVLSRLQSNAQAAKKKQRLGQQ